MKYVKDRLSFLKIYDTSLVQRNSYLLQNSKIVCELFQIPRVDDPSKIMERLKELADEYKKK